MDIEIVACGNHLVTRCAIENELRAVPSRQLDDLPPRRHIDHDSGNLGSGRRPYDCVLACNRRLPGGREVEGPFRPGPQLGGIRRFSHLGPVLISHETRLRGFPGTCEG